MTLLSSAAYLVHFASLLYVVAFLVRDQLVLRLLVLLATAFYICYYYFVPEKPLWDAIGWSIVLGLANLYITALIVLERTTFSLSEEEKELYESLNTLSPGEFRKLLKISTWTTTETIHQLTVEDSLLDHLHFVLRGTIYVEKKGSRFPIPPNCFIGEVAYFLKQEASASVFLEPGGRYVSWKRSDIDVLERKNPSIRIALHGLLTSDMARKVALSSQT